jgi:hypothetical protein
MVIWSFDADILMLLWGDIFVNSFVILYSHLMLSSDDTNQMKCAVIFWF